MVQRVACLKEGKRHLLIWAKCTWGATFPSGSAHSTCFGQRTHRYFWKPWFGLRQSVSQGRTVNPAALRHDTNAKSIVWKMLCTQRHIYIVFIYINIYINTYKYYTKFILISSCVRALFTNVTVVSRMVVLYRRVLPSQKLWSVSDEVQKYLRAWQERCGCLGSSDVAAYFEDDKFPQVFQVFLQIKIFRVGAAIYGT